MQIWRHDQYDHLPLDTQSNSQPGLGMRILIQDPVTHRHSLCLHSFVSPLRKISEKNKWAQIMTQKQEIYQFQFHTAMISWYLLSNTGMQKHRNLESLLASSPSNTERKYQHATTIIKHN